MSAESSPRFISLATPLIDITVSRVPRVRGDQLRSKTEQATKRDNEYYIRFGHHCRQGTDHGMREDGCKGIRDGKRARTIVSGFQKAYPDSSIRSVRIYHFPKDFSTRLSRAKSLYLCMRKIKDCLGIVRKYHGVGTAAGAISGSRSFFQP